MTFDKTYKLALDGRLCAHMLKVSFPKVAEYLKEIDLLSKEEL